MQKILMLMVALALALTACVAEDEPLELTETIDGTVFDTDLTVTYPDGWFATVSEEDNTIRIGNSDSALTGNLLLQRDGDAAGGVTLLLPDALSAYGLEADDSVTTIARALGDAFADGVENVTMNNPSSFDFEERRGAVVTGTALGANDSEGRIAIAIIDVGDLYAIVTLGSYGSEVNAADVARSMVESLTIN